MAQAAPVPASKGKQDRKGAAKAAPAVQRKLSVGGAGDHFEREADHVARKVMGGGSVGAIPPTITPLGAQCKKLVAPPKQREETAKPAAKAQRKAAAPAKAPKGEERKPAAKAQRKAAGPAKAPKTEEPKPAAKAQREPAAGGTKSARKDEPAAPKAKAAKPAQRKEGGGGAGGGAGGDVGMGGGVAPAGVESTIARLQSGGAPGLDNSTRGFMESRFGRDFSGVRVHRSTEAASAASALNARAFTVGNDVFFNRGQYQPHSAAGRELIAHELTHTVQQGASPGRAARRVQRGIGDDNPAPAPAASGATVIPIPSIPGASIDLTSTGTAKGTINVPRLNLPLVAGALKGAQGGTAAPAHADTRAFPVAGQPFDLRVPKPERDRDSIPAQVWTDQARTAPGFVNGMQTRLQQMLTATPNAYSFGGEAQPVYYMQLRRGSAERIFVGTLSELVSNDAFLRPQWLSDGSIPRSANDRFDADHFLEMQLGGADRISNMWLLKASYNRSVGSQIARNMRTDIEAIVNQAKRLPSVSQADKDKLPGNYEAARAEFNVHFNEVGQGTNYSTDTPYFWTRSQIASGEHLSALKFLTEPELITAGVRPDPNHPPSRIRVFPSLNGGWMKEFQLRANGSVVLPTDRVLFRGIEINSATFHGLTALNTEGADLMTFDVTVFKTRRTEGDELIERRNGTVTVKQAPRLGIAGYLSPESIRAAAATTRFKLLSPLNFSDMGISPDGQLTGVGMVGSTKLVLPGLNVPLMVYGDEIRMDFPIPRANLSLGPFSITETTVGLGVGPDGFFVQGYAGFEITGLGTGGVTATAGEGGITIDGDFNLITDFFNPASVGVTYDFLNDTLTARATLGIDRGKIPGVDSANVRVTITRDAVDVAGTINLGGPLAGSVIQVGYSRETGLTIGGTFPLPVSNIPGIQNATLTVGAVRDAGTGAWSFNGEGTANLALPGVTGNITIGYRDGVVNFTTVATVVKGPATGTLNFTATNGAIDEEGNPIEGEVGPSITAWGRGSVSVQFGIITGTVGIEYTRDNRVILSGEIALPPVHDVFPRRDYTRELLHLEPPEFPIWGVSVAGIGVGIFAFVDARVAFNAHVGPGQIRDASISAVMDLDRPEEATLHGQGRFVVPAYAGLSLDVGGGLRARAAVAFAEGRVGLTGELGLEAEAGAAIEFDWSRSAGLSLETTFDASVRPKFRLSANASVRVGVDLLFTDVSHTFGPWTRVLGEFGPDMELGVSFPVRWSEANGLDLSLDNMTVRQPTLDAPALMSSVFDQLVG